MRQRIWNVIFVHDNVPAGEQAKERLVKRFYVQEDADTYVEKHDGKSIDGFLIYTKRQPHNGETA